MAAYEFDGEKYKQASRHQKEWGNNLISQLHLSGAETVLDLGCGDGVLSEQIAQLVPKGKVIGIDASYGMLQTAKKIKCDNLSFIQMDINNMEFSNEFDIIFSNAALHWIKDHKRLLDNAYQALKFQGILLWDFGGSGNCANFIDVIQEKIRNSKFTEYFRTFEWPWFMPSKSQYEELVSSIGFSDFTITEVNRDRYFSNAEEMIKWIDQPCIVPFLKCIPDNKKTSFRDEIISEMMRKTRQPNGTYFETFRRLKIYAQK